MASKDIIELKTCPKCENAKLRRRGGKLVCGSKNCDYTEEIFGRNSKSWLLEIREDAKLWERGFFDRYPTPISFEYHRLFLMARHNQLFPMMYQLKDVMELLMKFPVLCAAAFLNDDEISKRLVEKQLSLGDWKKVADDLCDKKSGEYIYAVHDELRFILEDVKKLYNDHEVVHKRNDFFGHGALGFEDNEDYRKYCTELLGAAAEHLRKTRSAYDKLKLFVGEQELRGWRKAELLDTDAEAFIYIGGKKIVLSPYMVECADGLFLFDSFDGRKKKHNGLWLNYVKGGARRTFPLDYFANVYSRNITKTFDSGKDLGDSMSDKKIEEAFDALNSAYEYTAPAETVAWLRGGIGNDRAGNVLHLIMERGMGKSALAYALSGGTVKLDNTKICAFFCGGTQLRGVGSFTAGVKNSLMGDLKEVKSETVPNLGSSDYKTPEQRRAIMVETIKFFRGQYTENKLLLVIDGLDEVPSDCGEVFDYIPRPEEMPDNCYILLTSRNPKTENLSRCTLSALAGIKAGNVRTVRPSDTDNTDAMRKYAANKIKVRDKDDWRAPTSGEADRLLKLSGYIFLNLRVYAKLVEAGYAVKELPALDSKNLVGYYLDDIKHAYGEKLFGEALSVLLIIATAQEPLTPSEIAYLSGQGGVTLKLLTFLRDFGAILRTVRDDTRGTRFTVSSERYREYLEKAYAAEIKELSFGLYALFEGEDRESYIDENENEHIPDGVLYLASAMAEYVEKYGGAELAEKARESDLWKKFEEFGEAVQGMQDYRLERRITCYSGAMALLSGNGDENDIARLYRERGWVSYTLTQYVNALADYDRAIEMEEWLLKGGRLKDEDYIARARSNRAVTYHSLTRYNDALADYDKAIEIRERLFNEGKLHDENYIASARMNRAITYKALTRYDEALADYDRAIEIRERLFKEGKLNDENDIAMARINRAVTYKALTRYDEALADEDRAIEIRKQLFNEEKLYDENYIATARMNRAGTYHYLTRYNEALADYDMAIEIRERLFNEGKLHDENDIASARMNRANTLDSLTRYDEALADYDRAIEIRERLFKGGKLHDENDIATAKSNRATTLDSLTRYDEALADYDRAIEIRERLFKEGKLHDENDIATTRIKRAITYSLLNRYYDALADYDRAIEIRERLFNEGKLHDENYIARARSNRAIISRQLTRYDEALADYDRAIDIMERLFNEGKLHDENDIATARMNRAVTLWQIDRIDEAISEMEKVIAIRERLVTEGREYFGLGLEKAKEFMGILQPIKDENDN